MTDWEKNTYNVYDSQRMNRTKGTLQISKKKPTKWVNFENRKLIEKIQMANKHENITDNRTANSHNVLLLWKNKNKKTDVQSGGKNEGK